MCDKIAFTTWPKHENIFYKVTSGSLIFHVKAPRNAAIGLARKPGLKINYWVILGNNNQSSWIKKNDEHSNTVSTPGILSSEVFRTFWLSWYGGMIRVGRINEVNHIVSYQDKIRDLRYVTFSVFGEHNSVDWEIELPPPMLKTPRLRKLSTGGEPQWIPADVRIPEGAVIGGHEKETLYIIRARHNDSLTPGKFVPSQGVGFIPWGGGMHEKTDIEVLCGYDLVWAPTCDNKIPVGAVVAGFSEDRCRERLYVGRAENNGHLIPGKVQPSHNCCYIPYEDREIAKRKYEIMVSPFHNERSANSYYIRNINMDSDREISDDEDDANSDSSMEDNWEGLPL